MFLTRIGFGSKAVVTGDMTQVDVPGGRSGLLGLEQILAGIDGLEWVRLTSRDVVRHRIVQDIVDAYERATSAEPTSGCTPGEPPEGPDGPTRTSRRDGLVPRTSRRMPMPTRRRRRPAEGEVEVFVGDEQDEQPVDPARWVDLATASARPGVRGEAELSILFVDETTIAELNQRFMGPRAHRRALVPARGPDRAGPVARLGQHRPRPRRPRRGEPPLLLGDVVICPAVAARNAPDHAGTYEDELALLLVHGILHVLGVDHADPEEEAAMQAKERELLDRYHHGR